MNFKVLPIHARITKKPNVKIPQPGKIRRYRMAAEGLSTLSTPAPNADACNVRKDGNVYPDPFGLKIGNAFAGIPQNIVINLIIFGILLAIFGSLRKRKWGSAKIPLVGRRENDWSSIFYGNRGLDEQLSRSFAVTPESDRSPENDGYDVRMLNPELSATSSAGPDDALSFTSWVKNAFFARDEYLLERAGTAAIEYMRFQRHVIAFTAIITFISVGIVLPINYKGDLYRMDNTSFPKTTIGNVKSEADLLWVHVAFTIILFPMALLVMLSYGLRFGLVKREQKLPKTLMFYGLHPELATEERVRRHFEEAYPELTITAINFTIDVQKLMEIEYELDTVKEALIWCENSLRQSTERPVARDAYCGGCRCCGPEVDALEFYQNEKAKLEKQMLDEIQSFKRTNTVFFVTFATPEMAAQVHADYRKTMLSRDPPETSVSQIIKAKHWSARFAPSAPFVSWENLSLTGLKWWARALTINVIFFLFLFLISTPSVALNYVTTVIQMADSQALLSSLPFISQTLPTILLLAISGLIPVLIYYTVVWTGYHTKSKEQRAEMKLLFAFLLIAILIFPSLALSSLNVVTTKFLSGSDDAIRWECAFLPDNGALFVNLMITTAFVGSACQLLRIGQLLVFAARYFFFARSEAERQLILKTKIEFPYHEYYPDFILNFCIVAVYCYICPMVTPFGLLNLTLKHLVDRYNLSYVFKKTNAPSSVHASAVNFFLVAIIMQNFLMLFFFIVRSKSEIGPEAGILIATLVINLLIYVAISWFGLLKKVSLFENYNDDDVDTPMPSPVTTPVKKTQTTYIAPVLQKYSPEQLMQMANATSATVQA